MESATCPAADIDGTLESEEAFLHLPGETTPESTVIRDRAELVVTWRLIVVAVLTRFRRNPLLGET
jgi:hypothetical protein